MSDLENIKSLNEQLIAIAEKQQRMEVELDAALLGRTLAYRELEAARAEVIEVQALADSVTTARDELDRLCTEFRAELVLLQKERDELKAFVEEIARGGYDSLSGVVAAAAKQLPILSPPVEEK